MVKFSPDGQDCSCIVFKDSFYTGVVESPVVPETIRPTGYEINISEHRYTYTTGEFYVKNNRLYCATTSTASISVQMPKRLETGTSYRITIEGQNAPVTNSELRIGFSDNPNDYVYWKWNGTIGSGNMGLYLNNVDSTEYEQLRIPYGPTYKTLYCTAISKADKPGLDKDVVGYGGYAGLLLPSETNTLTTLSHISYASKCSGQLYVNDLNNEFREWNNLPQYIHGPRMKAVDTYSNENATVTLTFINNTGYIDKITIEETDFACCGLTNDLSWGYPTGLRAAKTTSCDGGHSEQKTIKSFYNKSSSNHAVCNSGIVGEWPVGYSPHWPISGYYRGCGLDFDSCKSPPSTLTLDIAGLTDGTMLKYDYANTEEGLSLTCTERADLRNNYANYACESICDCDVLNGSYTLYKKWPGLYESDEIEVYCPNATYLGAHCVAMSGFIRLQAAVELFYYDFGSSYKEISLGIGITGYIEDSVVYGERFNLHDYALFATGVDYSNGTFDIYGTPINLLKCKQHYLLYDLFYCGFKGLYRADWQCEGSPEQLKYFDWQDCDGTLTSDGTGDNGIADIYHPGCSYTEQVSADPGSTIPTRTYNQVRLPNFTCRLRTP